MRRRTLTRRSRETRLKFHGSSARQRNSTLWTTHKRNYSGYCFARLCAPMRTHVVLP